MNKDTIHFRAEQLYGEKLRHAQTKNLTIHPILHLFRRSDIKKLPAVFGETPLPRTRKTPDIAAEAGRLFQPAKTLTSQTKSEPPKKRSA